ncbi:MAG: hypothetical protein I3273_03725 [Candidatus Moeniiplasma glomeromycotorum]|nr:hypothetical protein [Candidatus Moeniiplasma glomeromycotorum]MCE8167960.1 hypothetical protein [Candidatus Moeniiplasma glomeromycotorum]MCE8169205.1 hypothetical protein [Candidatus Moeniiplasma glomeromycotorum]
MTAYDELKKKYDTVVETLDKWESEFPGQEPEDASKQLKAVNKKATDAKKEAEEAKDKLSEVENQVKEAEGIKKELDEWKELFPKKTPEEVKENLKKFANELKAEQQKYQEQINNFTSELEKERHENKEQLKEIQEKLGEAAKKSGVNELFDKIHERGERWTTESADKLLPGLAGEIPGTKVFVGLVAGVVSMGSGAAAVGVHEFDKTTSDIKELVEEVGTGLKEVSEKGMEIGVDLAKEVMDKADKAREGAKEFAIKIVDTGAEEFENVRKGAQEFAQDAMHVGADTAENFRKGAEILTGKAMDDVTKVVEKNLNIAEEAVKGGIGFQYGDLNVGVGVGKEKEKVLEAKVESKDEIIKRLEKELEDKKAEIEFLRKQQTQQAEKGQEGLLAVIEMAKAISRPNSPSNK